MSRPIERATLTILGTREQTIPVHFNPESLKYRINSTLRPGHGNRTKQHVARSTGSLAMDLIFDTTHNGDDVRALTSRIASLVEVVEENGRGQAPVVRFDWGSYSFKGMVESYDETIDFFAASGVPLRSKVSLSFAQQDVVFNEPTLPSADSQAGPEPVVALQAGIGIGVSVGGVASAAAQLGDPRAARSIGAANGQDNLRFGAGGSLTIDSSVSLGGPVAFASGGAGAGISAGVSASGGIGGQGSAGVSSSQGAFAGLRASAGVQAGGSLDIGALVPSAPTVSLGADPCSSFGVGGQTGFQGSASLRADVGASASLRTRIQFDAG